MQERAEAQELYAIAFEHRYLTLGGTVLCVLSDHVRSCKAGRAAMAFWSGNAAQSYFLRWRCYLHHCRSRRQHMGEVRV